MKVNFYDYNNNRYVEYEQKKVKPASFESISKRTRGKPSRSQMRKDLGKYIKDEDVLDLVMTLSESELVKNFYTCETSEHRTKKGKKRKEYVWDFDEEKLDNWIEEATKEEEDDDDESEEDEDISDEEYDEDEEDEKWFNAINQKDKEKKEEEPDKKEEPEEDEEVKKEEEPKEDKEVKKEEEPKEDKEVKKEEEPKEDKEEESEEEPKKKAKEPEPEEDEGEEDFRSDVYKPAEYRLVFDLLGKKLNNKTKNLVKEKKLKDDAGSIFKLQKSVNGFEEGTLFWVGNKREINTFAEKMLLSEFDVWDLMAWTDTIEGINNIDKWEDRYNDKNYLNKEFFEHGIWDWAYAKAEKSSKLKSTKYETRLEELVATYLKDFPGYTSNNFRYNKKTGKVYFVEPTKDKILSGDELREASLDMLKRRVATNVVIDCQEKTKGNISSIMNYMFGENWYAIIHSDEYKEEWSGFDNKFKFEFWARDYVEKDKGVSFVFQNFAKPTKGETKHPEDNIHVMNVFVNRTQQENLYYATLDKRSFKELGLEQMLENMID